MLPPFEGFGKIARLNRNCIITEKIDGTNALIYINEDLSPFECKSGRVVPFLCGSRKRWIFPEEDNHGFATWAYKNADELLKLGPGRHFGEWWGASIQRTYGLKEKKFSLFNVGRWGDNEIRPTCCSVVPILYEGNFTTNIVQEQVDMLKDRGSCAAIGFPDPEGIVVYLSAAKTMFKVTCKDDEKPKGKVE